MIRLQRRTQVENKAGNNRAGLAQPGAATNSAVAVVTDDFVI